MLGTILGRVAQGVVVLLIVAAASFALLRFVGDPVANMLGQDAGLEERAALRERLGLEDPAPVQFARFLAAAAQGDFGVSYRLQRPVAEILAERLPATLELVAASALLAIALGIPLGLLTGLRPSAWWSRALLTLSLVGVSLPTFVIGILLIWIFAVQLGWLPSFGRGGGLTQGDGWRHLILPAITLSLFQMTVILRLVRAQAMEVLRSEFVRFARARGLAPATILWRHVLGNTLVPVITLIGLNVGSLIGFSIVTETVFQWPGLGSLFVQAVAFADVPLLAAYLILVAAVFVAVNLAVDLIYLWVDPRLRDAASGG